LEVVVRRNRQDDEEVARSSTVETCPTLICQPYLSVAVHARRYFDFLCDSAFDDLTAVALAAYVGDQLTGPVTGVAGRDVDKLPQYRLLDAAHFPRTITGGAGNRPRTWLRAAAATDRAR